MVSELQYSFMVSFCSNKFWQNRSAENVESCRRLINLYRKWTLSHWKVPYCVSPSALFAFSRKPSRYKLLLWRKIHKIHFFHSSFSRLALNVSLASDTRSVSSLFPTPFPLVFLRFLSSVFVDLVSVCGRISPWTAATRRRRWSTNQTLRWWSRDSFWMKGILI